MLKYLLIIILFASCTTAHKVESYLDKHEDVYNNVTRKYIDKHQVKGAQICLDAFPHKETHDTLTILKDSLISEKITDTLYKWMTDTKYITKDKIRTLLKPCDSIQYITTTVYDSKYKILYDDKAAQYNDLTISLHKTRTWLFVIVLFIVLRGLYFVYQKNQ